MSPRPYHRRVSPAALAIAAFAGNFYRALILRYYLPSKAQGEALNAAHALTRDDPTMRDPAVFDRAIANLEAAGRKIDPHGLAGINLLAEGFSAGRRRARRSR